jgi:hypothetical protein
MCTYLHTLGNSQKPKLEFRTFPTGSEVSSVAVNDVK